MTFACLPTTEDDATSLRNLIRHLRDAELPGAAALARTLMRCDDRRPCRSAACPHCGREFQLALFKLYREQIKAPARLRHRGRTSVLTIVPAAGIIEPEHLDAEVLHRVSEEVADALAACRLPPAIVTLDVSYNEDDRGRTPEHWCVHAQGVVSNWLSEGHLEALRARFPRTSRIRKPVDTDTLDNNPRGALYHLKPDRCRRVSYVVPAVEGGRNAYRDTKRYSLRPMQRVALALAEHEVGFEGRLISHDIGADAVEALFDAFYRVRDGP